MLDRLSPPNFFFENVCLNSPSLGLMDFFNMM
jgi:hypothetical protein